MAAQSLAQSIPNLTGCFRPNVSTRGVSAFRPRNTSPSAAAAAAASRTAASAAGLSAASRAVRSTDARLAACSPSDWRQKSIAGGVDALASKRPRGGG